MNGTNTTDMDRIASVAAAALQAQQVIDAIRRGEKTTLHAWLVFCELASVTGWKSPACRSLICELAKVR